MLWRVDMRGEPNNKEYRFALKFQRFGVLNYSS